MVGGSYRRRGVARAVKKRTTTAAVERRRAMHKKTHVYHVSKTGTTKKHRIRRAGKGLFGIAFRLWK